MPHFSGKGGGGGGVLGKNVPKIDYVILNVNDPYYVSPSIPNHIYRALLIIGGGGGVTSAYVLSFLDSMIQRTCFLEHWRTRTDSCCKGEAMIKVVARKSLKTVD